MPDDSSSLFRNRHPHVVATISSAAGWTKAEKIIPGSDLAPDLLEVRADLLPENIIDLSRLPLPVILTVRHPSEGGRGPADAASRIAIYQRHWKNAVAIDIELASVPELSSLISEARKMGLACIFSHHDFTDTPSLTELRAMTQIAAHLGANLFKVATTTDDVAQLSTLLAWVESESRLPLAAMGMGRLGKISRPLLAQIGSQLNYGYLDAPVVPGQWPASELRRVIDSLP
ncbi:MAG: type I 3-dehydroquinate dehydratase [Chthoniobacterales bacterium]